MDSAQTTTKGDDMNRIALGSAAAGLAMAVGLMATPSAAQDVLRVSGTGANPPFHYIDPATNEQVGITMDMFAAIAPELGMTVEILPVIPLTDMPAAVLAGTVDAYGGNITMSQARIDAGLLFSNQWYQGVGEGVWVLATDTTDYRSVQDFAGQVIGAQRGSATFTALNAMTGAFAAIREYDNQDLLAQAVIDGEIAAAFLPRDTSAYVLFQGQYPQLRMPENYVGTINVGNVVATPFNPANPGLVDRFNTALARLMVNGTITAIFANYGLTWPVAAR
jgi:polar amino acid transport system substrate-binding protein